MGSRVVTRSRKRPEGGAVYCAGSVECCASSVATSSFVMDPRPTSARIPTTRRTIFQTKMGSAHPDQHEIPASPRGVLHLDFRGFFVGVVFREGPEIMHAGEERGCVLHAPELQRIFHPPDKPFAQCGASP